jgi:dCMP deaminase
MPNRPEWDEYFMSIAFVVAQKSIDPRTKHGTVVINDEKTIIATGYNGPPRGCEDDLIPLLPPKKYLYMSHSEINAIANAARSGMCLRNSTFYITGHPCHVCFRSIINCGAKKIIYSNVSSYCVKDEDLEAINIMMQGRSKNDFEFVKYDGDVKNLLNESIEYIKRKNV